MITRRAFVGLAGVCGAVLTAPVPVATAQPEHSPCMVAVDSAPPVATPQQADYRRRLHRLATGAGVKVAVIDTGVAPHPQLPRLEDGPDLVGESTSLHDCDFHGTIVAGVIAAADTGLAPGATILSIRQSSAHFRRDPNADPGAGDLETLSRAIEEAVQAGAQVINVSVVSWLPPPTAAGLDTGRLDSALARAEEAGAVVIAAAGNAGAGCDPGDVVYPSHASTVVAVAAVDSPHELAEYSLPGAVSAPGLVPVALGLSGGWSRAKLAPSDTSAQPLMGTSFAAPVVAATAALLRERHPDYSAAQIRGILLASAEANGYVDPLSAVSYVGTSPHGRRHGDAAPVIVPTAQSAQSGAPRRLALLVGALTLAALLLSSVRATDHPAASRRRHG